MQLTLASGGWFFHIIFIPATQTFTCPSFSLYNILVLYEYETASFLRLAFHSLRRRRSL